MKNTRKNKAWLGSGRGNLARDLLLICVVALALAAAALASDLFIADEQQTVEKTVRILRVMTDNPNTCMPVEGQYRDWIELTNLSSKPVNTKGWRLSDQVDIRGAFVLPERTLQSGESLILYEGMPIEGADPAVFTGFSMKTDGQWLFLTDGGETLLDSVEIPALEAGYVYALDIASDTYSQHSPYDDLGAGLDLSSALKPENNGGLVISELMASNGSTIRDQNNAYSDWIEIYNAGSSAVNLEGWTLSDDPMNRARFVFPGRTIAPGEYLLIFASGAEDKGQELHVPFRLSSGGEHIVLYNPQGEAVSYMEYDALEKNQSLARMDGAAEKTFMPSPGNENTAAGAKLSIDKGYTTLEENSIGLYISEVISSAKGQPDWIELINRSGETIDLSGFGISDNPNKARKWRFPEGASIPSGSCITVALMGLEYTADVVDGVYCADFALDADADQTLLLSDADGNVIDRMLLTAQRRDVSFGRSEEHGSYRYFTEPTPGKANSGKSYAYCARDVSFSHPGGVQSGPIDLVLSSNEGMTIYYTTDGTEPTINSSTYKEPIRLDSNTVIRAVAYRKDGIPSDVIAHTYIFGVEHNLGIVAVSGKRSDLNGSGGILRTGKGTTGKEVQVEIYDPEGNNLINQKCELKLNGRSSRTMFDQKAFRLVAKEAYGDTKFRASLFTNRDYDEYNAVVIRAAGQDNQRALMRDVIITSLARNTSLFYQESEPVVVYVNGNYWGVYHMRERVDPHAIAQFEGWENEDQIDFLEGAYGTVVQGSNETFKEAMSFVNRYGVKSDANLEKLRKIVDVENYLDYVILQIYSNNQDLNNVRMYRSTEGDGKWRWILYDTDLGLLATRNSVKAWCSTSNGGKVGSITEQSNMLFTELLKNPTIRDYFLTRFGELLATDLSADSVVARIEEVYNAIAPEMKRHCKRWSWSVSSWEKEGGNLLSYVKKRPATLVSQLIDEFNLSSAQAEHYFGAAKAAN